MKTRPILFSTEMVRAILDGRKTQTRRKVSEKIMDRYYEYDDLASSVGKCDGFSRMWEKEYLMLHCPYEVVMILWVRETWQLSTWLHPSDENYGYIYKASDNGREWEANDEEWKWKPSIFMPREACRLYLQITDIRVERLQDITEEDARAEGANKIPLEHLGNTWETYRQGFESLWHSINGPESWDANPYVWVISFKIYTP